MADAPEGELLIRATAMAADANPYGSAFVGWLMGQMALAAGSLASRLCGGRAPVVAADDFAFPLPVAIGDELSCYGTLVAQGRSSMTIAVSAWARPRHEGDARLAARGRFTLVSMGADGRPAAIGSATD